MATAPSDRVPSPTGPGVSLRLPMTLFGEQCVLVADGAHEQVRVEVGGEVVIDGHLPGYLSVRMRDVAIDCLRAVGERHALDAVGRWRWREQQRRETQHSPHVLGQRDCDIACAECQQIGGHLGTCSRSAMRDPSHPFHVGQRDPLHPEACRLCGVMGITPGQPCSSCGKLDREPRGLGGRPDLFGDLGRRA